MTGVMGLIRKGVKEEGIQTILRPVSVPDKLSTKRTVPTFLIGSSLGINIVEEETEGSDICVEL